MTLPAAAEIPLVEQPAKPKPPPRKRTTSKRATPSSPAAAKPRSRAATAKATASEPPAPAAPPAAAARRRTHLRALLAFVALLAGCVLASVLLLGDGGSSSEPTPQAAGVSAAELATRAGTLGAPVYWAGALPGRTLELTSSDTGTFVRYLPAGTTVGSDRRTLTIATYPMADAYATASRRSRADGMTSHRTRSGGLAVWSIEQPTSVYVAWRGVPSLVEVYAPRAADARETALGGRLRPVR